MFLGKNPRSNHNIYERVDPLFSSKLKKKKSLDVIFWIQNENHERNTSRYKVR